MHRGATGGIGTDHHLLRAKVRLHLKCRPKNKREGRLRLDYLKLTDDNSISAFKTEIKRHRQMLRRENENLSVNEKFRKFVGYVREHGKQYFGNKNRYKKTHKEWFTPELKEIVDQKAKAYVDWHLHRTKVCENKYRNKY